MSWQAAPWLKSQKVVQQLKRSGLPRDPWYNVNLAALCRRLDLHEHLPLQLSCSLPWLRSNYLRLLGRMPWCVGAQR